MQRIYLDHTATTPLDPQVMEAMMPYFGGTFGNASSVHWFGRQAKIALESSRETIARAIGAETSELFFTSGGTESDNLAIIGVSRRAGGKNHIVTTAVEHHAVLDTCRYLETHGYDITYLPVDRNGGVSARQVQDAIRETTCLVSIMYANNEVGTLYPVRDIGNVTRERGVLFHVDAVQAVGRLPLNLRELNIDLLTASAHKLYGPKGIGLLVVRKGTAVEPIFHGGGQEQGTRPGTESVPLAVGFAKAVEMAYANLPKESRRLSRLRDGLEEALKKEFDALVVNGDPVQRLPNILSISFDSRKVRIEGEMLVMNMDLEGVAVTSGSACTSGSMQPSHVLRAMGRDEMTAKATLRFSFGRGNTEEDVPYVIESLSRVLKRMMT